MIDGSNLWLPKCPECGQPAVGTSELIPALARIDGVTLDGEPIWNGHVELDSEGQRTEVDDNDRSLLVCDNSHAWIDEWLHPGSSRPPAQRIADTLETIVDDEDVPTRARDVVRWALGVLKGVPPLVGR